MKKVTTLLVAFCATTALWAAFTPKAFTVSAGGKQVYFSQGNLQCSGVASSNYTWSFAENQYEMLGTANVSGSGLADKIDLFGWSGDNETAKWGISTSKSNDDYSGDFVDWGKNIGDGTTYRTLTYDEWNYLLNKRTNASEKMGVACIQVSGTESVNGLILLPDSWDCPKDITFQIGFSNSYSIEAYATHQTFTIAQWQQLEAAGAVFLPASGFRNGSGVYFVQEDGDYWFATPEGSIFAYGLSFYSNEMNMVDGNERCYGLAVRLVREVSSPVTALQPAQTLDLRTENGSVIYDGEFQIFDLLGRNVTRMNGSLNGVYIVKVGDKAQKIVVK